MRGMMGLKTLLKIDLCMWTKNGEASLPEVLEQIDKVIPHENVCCKILVDDNSTDRTTEIAKEYGWKIYSNPCHGVPSGANEALRHVDQEFFASFEQDVLLSPSWWGKMQKYMNDPQVGCAQGIRVSTQPMLKAIDQWQYANQHEKLWFSLDNNIFRTKTVRTLQGFPETCPVFCDSALVKRFQNQSFKWIVDMNVVSLHIRSGLRESVNHQFKLMDICYSCQHSPECVSKGKPNLKNMLKIFITSPIRGIQIAIRQDCPKTIFAYPLVRFYYVDATLKFLKKGTL
jgi:hypothetical protein